MSPVWDDPRIRSGLSEQFAERTRRLASGERSVGWKVAFGSPQAMEQLGLEAPLVGFMSDRTRLESGSVVSVDAWTKPAFEAEIAIYLGADVPSGASEDVARAAIIGLGPAIEVADMDRPPAELDVVLANDIYHRAVILGPFDRSRAGGDPTGVEARVLCDGEQVAKQTNPTVAPGRILDLTRHVADLVGAFGETLRSGEVIISGSVTPILFPEAGQEFVADFGDLGQLSARFQA